MSTEDGRFDDGSAAPVRVADFDALDEPEESGPTGRVASFDEDDADDADDADAPGDAGGSGPVDGSDALDAPGQDPRAEVTTVSAPTAGFRTVDLDGDPDAGEPPRTRVVSFETPSDGGGSDGGGSGGTVRRARFDGPSPAGRRDSPGGRPGDRPGGGPGGGRRAGAAGSGDVTGGRRATRSARGPARADAVPPQDDESRAKEICLRLLTDRARTVKELRDALVRKEIPDDVADRVLERFDEVGLVDDEAFAGQWVRSRHRHRGLGKRAIAQELRRKGVAKEIADEALTEIDAESEEARARELVEKKIRTVKVGTREERASASRRLVGMLARKGYGAGVAYSVVRDAIAARGAEEDEMGEEPPQD